MELALSSFALYDSSYIDVEPDGGRNKNDYDADGFYELVMHSVVVRFIEDLRFVSFRGNKTAKVRHQ